MQVDVQNTTVLSADGSSIKLGEYAGEVILVVNVASYCGKYCSVWRSSKATWFIFKQRPKNTCIPL